MGSTAGKAGQKLMANEREFVVLDADVLRIGASTVLFVVAAITFDPKKAGGLDAALRTVRDQPFGPYLLTLMALGLAAFGLYCFAWAKHPKKS